MVDKCHGEHYQGGEKCRSRGQPIQPVNQVESVGDCQDPEKRKRQAQEPGKVTPAEEHR